MSSVELLGIVNAEGSNLCQGDLQSFGMPLTCEAKPSATVQK